MTSESPIRLIAIDIDGTLLDSRGALPARNRHAVHRAIEQGFHVALVTGRAFHHARPIAEALAPDSGADDLALIVSNGALTKRVDGATLDGRLIPRKTAAAIVEAMRPRHRGVAVIFDRSDARQYVFERIDWSHPQRHWYYERNRAFITRVEPIDEALTEDPAQVAFTGGVEQMRALAGEIRALRPAPDVTITLTEYAERDFSLLDLIAGGWSKGAALRELRLPPGARPHRGHGGRRQPERPRDAGVRRASRRDGKRRGPAQATRLGDHRDPRRMRPRGRHRQCRRPWFGHALKPGRPGHPRRHAAGVSASAVANVRARTHQIAVTKVPTRMRPVEIPIQRPTTPQPIAKQSR